jgi:hypothetical protein
MTIMTENNTNRKNTDCRVCNVLNGIGDVGFAYCNDCCKNDELMDAYFQRRNLRIEFVLTMAEVYMLTVSLLCLAVFLASFKLANLFVIFMLCLSSIGWVCFKKEEIKEAGVLKNKMKELRGQMFVFKVAGGSIK